MDDSLLLRAATQEDGPAIENMAREVSLSFVAERDLGRSAGIVLVASLSGTLVGFGAAQLAADEAEILDIAVLPAFRRRGIGLQLLGALTEEAAAGGATRLLLEVRRSNLAALRLYERAGFVQVGERLRYYRGGEDALVLCSSLKEST